MPDGLPQLFVGDEEFLGLGAPVAKLFELLSVSVQPPLALSAAVVLVSVGAAAPSKKFALP